MPEVKSKEFQAIADALADHVGLDLGDLSNCDDLDHFAHVVEVAAKNRGRLPRRKRANRSGKLQMSLRRQNRREPDWPYMSEDQIAAAFTRQDEGSADAVAEAFLKVGIN